MKAQIPLGKQRFVTVEVPVDFNFNEIPKVLVRILVWLRTCASTCTLNK
jgi:hypothetical protein